MKIALVHLCSFGDCLYATVIARQIKSDFPACHLTWVIGDKYASVLEGNPFVDSIKSFPVLNVQDAISNAWKSARSWTELHLSSGEFKMVFYTQICPDNVHLYDGLIRSTIYRAFGRQVSPPHRPVLNLGSHEISAVDVWAARNALHKFKHIFLFECAPSSGQSPMSPARAMELALELARRHPDAAFCLSSMNSFNSTSPQILDASGLTFRQNLALMRHCTGLLGCSSGLTWLSTSEGAANLPMLQILTKSTAPFRFASVAADFATFGLDDALVIELAEPADTMVLDCLGVWISQSHKAARARFHQTLGVNHRHASAIYASVRGRQGVIPALRTLIHFVFRNGWSVVPWRLLISEPPSLLLSMSRRFASWLTGVKRFKKFPAGES